MSLSSINNVPNDKPRTSIVHRTFDLSDLSPGLAITIIETENGQLCMSSPTSLVGLTRPTRVVPEKFPDWVPANWVTDPPRDYANLQ